MKVTFLGTGTSQGVPLIGCNCEVCISADNRDKRLRTSILVETDGNTFVIDTGPDFRQQMLREKVEKIDAVIFTHEHKDHTAGFDDIRAYNFLLKKKIDVYATLRVQESLKKEFSYIFADEQYPGIPQVTLHHIENKPFNINQTEIIPIQAFHFKLPVLGFRIKDFTYITDANSIAEKEMEKLRGTKVLVLNALRKEEHISHFTLHQAVELMHRIRPEKGYFTHISHQLGLHEEINRELPDFLKLSYDGLKIEI
ncbi:MAG: MBL fold metallo-hydrolase [Bacteroidetes bacterium]|nr:MBL fold metallo-hydrolase [Bacteroidota bacterium]HET6244062.1 MBL fold metallo-hydrolase [Bacteroidia bacterium]